MVRFLLPGCGEMRADAADALAVAICHAHTRTSRNRIAAAERLARAS
jgi:crossover junction endodeoxyribonuclease RuvC